MLMTAHHASGHTGERQAGEGGMPARPVTFIGGLFALVFIALLAGLGYFLVHPATLPVRQVRIEGEFRYLSPAILQALVRDRVRGGFFNVNVNALRDAILAEPWVREVSVHRLWPDGLQVFVQEQAAIAKWKNAGLLNRQGGFFAPDKTTYPPDLPLLEGPPGTQALVMGRYLQLETMLRPFDLAVVRLTLDDRRAWDFELDNGLGVVLGRRDFDGKADRFIRQVLVNAGRGAGEMKRIDMRYTNGFAVEWRDDHAGNGESSGVQQRW